MLMQADTDAARLRELGYEPELARTLSVRDLVIHGLIYMVPLAPIGIFGILYNMSAGAVAAVYVIAAVAMCSAPSATRRWPRCSPSPARPTAMSASGRTASSDSSQAGRSCSTICSARAAVRVLRECDDHHRAFGARLDVGGVLRGRHRRDEPARHDHHREDEQVLPLHPARHLGRVPHLGSGSGPAGTGSPHA